MLASIFPAQHEKAHITKDLHICQRFGAARKGGGKKRQEKKRFITFQKFNLELGLFWHKFMKFRLQSRRVLTAFHRRPLFRSARGYHKRQEGEWKETQAITGGRGMYVMIGQLHWAVAAMLGLDQIIRPFFQSLFRSCVINVAANAPKAFSNPPLNSACTGKSMI